MQCAASPDDQCKTVVADADVEPSGGDMGVLDPRLQSLLATRAHHEELVRARELAPEDAPATPDRVGVLVKYTGDVADLKHSGSKSGLC